MQKIFTKIYLNKILNVMCTTQPSWIQGIGHVDQPLLYVLLDNRLIVWMLWIQEKVTRSGKNKTGGWVIWSLRDCFIGHNQSRPLHSVLIVKHSMVNTCMCNFQTSCWFWLTVRRLVVTVWNSAHMSGTEDVLRMFWTSASQFRTCLTQLV